MDSGVAALDRVQATAAPELAEYNDACGQVGLLPEVELAVAKLLLIVDERRQRERLLPVVFVRGFQVRNMDLFCRWFIKMTHKSDPWKKILQRINVTHIKKEFKLKTYSNKRSCMQCSSLNTTLSIQKYNSGISLIIIYYYTLCKGSRWALGEM
jgi:hypothetical protein